MSFSKFTEGFLTSAVNNIRFRVDRKWGNANSFTGNTINDDNDERTWLKPKFGIYIGKKQYLELIPINNNEENASFTKTGRLKPEHKLIGACRVLKDSKNFFRLNISTLDYEVMNDFEDVPTRIERMPNGIFRLGPLGTYFRLKPKTPMTTPIYPKEESKEMSKKSISNLSTQITNPYDCWASAVIYIILNERLEGNNHKLAIEITQALADRKLIDTTKKPPI